MLVELLSRSAWLSVDIWEMAIESGVGVDLSINLILVSASWVEAGNGADDDVRLANLFQAMLSAVSEARRL